MVKVRIKDVYDSFVKGNSLMLISSLGFMSFVSLIALLTIGVLYYINLQQYWALIVFGVITIGFIILAISHLSCLPMLAKNDEYFGNLVTCEISVEEDTGLLVEGYDKDGKKIKNFYVYWDDINKINYTKHYFAIQCFGSEMFFIEDRNSIYLEGNPKTLEYYLRNNVDRRAIKFKKWKKVVK